MFECPIYKEFNACTIYSNCVFKKADDCAIELAAIFSEENHKRLEKLEREIQDIKSQLSNIEQRLRKLADNKKGISSIF